ncbi:MAG TPA: hypothetical protein DHV62_00145 [Elusimicrobia bacterium]|jgi:predicted phosphodiesterase|nr:hypothetical protein [Elusimicrobiota bacterium]
MKYAIFADVHSNLEALNIILEYYSKEKVDKYFCCGDLVGYGPNPNECIEKVRQLKAIVVAGNHDLASVGLKDISWFNENAQASILWTQKKLTPENISYLRSLPQIYQDKDLTLVHGSPRDPIDEYLLNLNQARENLNFFPAQVCFIGHSHTPFFYQKKAEGAESYGNFLQKNPVVLNLETKTIINVGSVGQPRDGDPRSACATYELEKKEIYLARFEYNILPVQQKMLEANLPHFLIDRLSYGH